MQSTDIVARLREAFRRVEYFPEDSETGFVDLLHLRNLVPDAIREIETLRDKILRGTKTSASRDAI